MESSSLGAIVVTYFPEGDYNDRILKIRSQFQYVVVVDNSAGSIDFSGAIIDKIILIKNDKNLGVAQALNQGVGCLLGLDVSWVACFDQDTLIENDYLSVMSRVVTDCDESVGVYGAGFKKTNFLSRFLDGSKGSAYWHCKTVITSGSIFPISLWSAVGGFNEGYFIDSVDHEFCLNVRSRGYNVVRSKQKVIKHEIGEKDKFKGFGFVPVHSPVRKYYITRNVILTIKQYLTAEPVWCLKQLARLFLELMSIILVENNKLRKLKCFFLGGAHGVMGKKGTYISGE